jgi:hypothetical protein
MPRFNQGYKRSPDLTREQVREIQQRRAKGELPSQLCSEFKISRGRFADVISGRYELKRWGEIL